MSLANEAGYLYILSKKLMKLTKKIHHVTEKAQKLHAKRQRKPEVEKYKVKLHYAQKKLEDLRKDHQEILAKLRHHQVAFAHQLQKTLGK